MPCGQLRRVEVEEVVVDLDGRVKAKE